MSALRKNEDRASAMARLPEPSKARAEAANTAARIMTRAELGTWLLHHDFPGFAARGVNGDTPLMRAAWHGEDAVVEALLADGAEPQAVNDEGNNALWYACLHGGPATILRLADAGVSLDHANDDGITCLMQAAASGRVGVLELLMALGATPGLSAPDGRSAFDMAADRGRDLLRAARRLGHG